MRATLWLISLFILMVPSSSYYCDTGAVTRHDAWESVLYHFPERFDAGADGYAGVSDCGAIGDELRLWAGGRWWTLKVADCLNANHAEDHASAWSGWVADVDGRVWAVAGLSNRPQFALVCASSIASISAAE